MGTSFVTLASGRRAGSEDPAVRTGIWVEDSMLQLLLRLAALHVPEPLPGADGADARDIRERWLLASGVPFVGCVPHDLDVVAANRNRLSVARAALVSLSSALDDMRPRIPGGSFSLLGMGEPASRDLATDDLKAIVSDIVGLIDAAMAQD